MRNILVRCLSVWVFELECGIGVGECCQCENIQFQCCQFPIGNWYWQHFHNGNIYKCWSMELESGIFGNNRDKRSARGADPTTARTPLATAYAARYARVIPVIAPYLNPAVHRMLAMIGRIEKGLILWREAGCGPGEEYARLETMTQERRGWAKT